MMDPCLLCKGEKDDLMGFRFVLGRLLKVPFAARREDRCGSVVVVAVVCRGSAGVAFAWLERRINFIMAHAIVVQCSVVCFVNVVLYSMR
jgi:hypothetical protein